MIAPPPVIFAVAFALGVVLDWAVPAAPVRAMLARVRVLGFAMLAIGVSLAASAVVLFIRHRTTIVPHGRARSLVAGGPYRLTRNPMYLGLTCIYAGLAITFQLYGPLPLLLIPLTVLHRYVIPFEESTMHLAFGDEYTRYAGRTRRWL
jgi:protein-S-isoprenylcysteine O-methyltransferase Ste14